MTALAPTLQAFFTERLIAQRQASPHTIAAYRDTFRLLLGFAAQRTGKRAVPTSTSPTWTRRLIGAFLDHLERERGNSVRTRNARLAAIHSLFRYAALRHPEHAAAHRTGPGHPAPSAPTQTTVTYLTADEVDALLAAPDRPPGPAAATTPCSLLAIQTGLRVSELTGLTCGDVHLGTGAHVALPRARAARTAITPLTPGTVAVLRAWLAERAGQPGDPLFPTRRGGPLSRDAVSSGSLATPPQPRRTCPSLPAKTSPPHVLRHSAAMTLLHAGVDIAVIALWLGHENRSPQRRSTCTPTWRSRSEPSPGPRRPRSTPGRYRPPTSSSPSSKPCDYADIPAPRTPACQHRQRDIGITAVSG